MVGLVSLTGCGASEAGPKTADILRDPPAHEAASHTDSVPGTSRDRSKSSSKSR